jgi:poly-gamma-glutamate capsule biosynthesis protein CapA/YwtB (metallophosphatase superfamily)
MERAVRLMLGGDVMLGRLVKEQIELRGASYPLGAIAALMREADLTIVNLECAITASNQLWPGRPKAFYFGAPPEAVRSLAEAGVDGVTLANNHVLDFGVAGLRDTLRHLKEHGIGQAGAGRDIADALAPVYFERNGIRFGMVAYCDHQPDFAATEHTPGIAYLDVEDEARALEEFQRGLARIKSAPVDWPILSLHWGPNMVNRPSPSFKRLAHAAIDMGYALLFGHSAHVFHGIEIYRGRPIFYAAGDLVDDYYVDPAFRNDHQLLFELTLDRTGLRRIDLHPVFIDDCRTVAATGERFDYVAGQIALLCGEMGTKVQREGGKLWIEANAPGIGLL